MNKLQRLFFLLALVPLLVFTACKDEDPVPVTDDFNTLKTHLVTNNLDLPDILNGWIEGVSAEADADTWADSYYILDLRAADAFNAGHIKGAVNTTLTNLLTDAANAGGKPIRIVCYTGQSAGHALVALRLSGYDDAKVLKFGMSQWGMDTSGPWANNVGDAAVGHSQWRNQAQIRAKEQFNYAAFNAQNSDGAAMLQERVNAMLQNGFQGVANADVLGNPDGFFINNYWAEDDTNKYGHIEGSYRIQPLSFAAGTIKNLDPDATVVTYCWTGQTSSVVTAYLTVLGYDAKSLKFGCNGMIYSELEGHKYSLPSVDLPVVTE